MPPTPVPPPRRPVNATRDATAYRPRRPTSSIGRPPPPGAGPRGWQPFTVDQEGLGAARAEKDFAAQLQQWRPTPPAAPTGPGPSRGPSGRDYGGGSGDNPDPLNWEKSAKLDALMATMTGAVSADQLNATNRFADLDKYMAGLGNPYASIGPAQQAQVQSDDLSNLLQSQGGDDAGLRAQAQFMQSQNAAGAGASDRRAQMLRATQDAWNQSSRTSGQLAGQQVQGDLAAQLLAMKAAIEAQKAAL